MSNMETDGRKREKGEFGGTMVANLFWLEERKVVNPNCKVRASTFLHLLGRSAWQPQSIPLHEPQTNLTYAQHKRDISILFDALQ